MRAALGPSTLDDLLAALEALGSDMTEARDLVNTRHLEGGQPLIDFLEDIDGLFPELVALCEHRWMLELLVSLCKMREGR